MASKPAPLRVLVADDDRETANVLAAILRDEGGERYRPADAARCRHPRIRERRGPLAPLLIAISGTWKDKSDRRARGEASGDK